MSQPSWPSEDQQQWTQPPFAAAPLPQSAPAPDPNQPAADPNQPPVESFPPGAYRSAPPPPFQTPQNPYDAVSGVVIMPGQSPHGQLRQRVPPSPLEATLRAVSGVLFPILVALAVFGVVGWFPAIFIAIMVPGVLNQIAASMKRQRIEKARYQASSPPREDLR